MAINKRIELLKEQLGKIEVQLSEINLMSFEEQLKFSMGIDPTKHRLMKEAENLRGLIRDEEDNSLIIDEGKVLLILGGVLSVIQARGRKAITQDFMSSELSEKSGIGKRTIDGVFAEAIKKYQQKQ